MQKLPFKWRMQVSFLWRSTLIDSWPPSIKIELFHSRSHWLDSFSIWEIWSSLFKWSKKKEYKSVLPRSRWKKPKTMRMMTMKKKTNKHKKLTKMISTWQIQSSPSFHTIPMGNDWGSASLEWSMCSSVDASTAVRSRTCSQLYSTSLWCSMQFLSSYLTAARSSTWKVQTLQMAISTWTATWIQ